MCPHTSSPHPRLGKQFTSYKPQTRSSSKEKTVVWKRSGIMWITEFPNKQLFFSSVYCWCSGFGFFFTFSSPRSVGALSYYYSILLSGELFSLSHPPLLPWLRRKLYCYLYFQSFPWYENPFPFRLERARVEWEAERVVNIFRPPAHNIYTAQQQTLPTASASKRSEKEKI